MKDKILKRTIYWHLKYSCPSLSFMTPEEKEEECRKIMEQITKNYELWKFLKSSIRDNLSEETFAKSFNLHFSEKGLRIFSIEKAVYLGLKDAEYLLGVSEKEGIALSFVD